ncbi:MAG: hypothetical protein ACK2U9_06745 [Anaerolineae bacterium]|jgi:hypothetical protein
MNSNPTHPRRRAFLLRCWSIGTPEHLSGVMWRFSLERVDGRFERRGFASLTALVEFIQSSLEEDDHQSQEEHR